MNKAPSKPLGHYDESGFLFSREMLNGEPTFAINFDSIQHHPEKGYIIFEYLLVDEKQFVTPYTSHPRRYWYKAKMKFISLWKVAQDLNATLYLVIYAKKGTQHENKVKLIEVLELNHEGIVRERATEMTRSDFGYFYRSLNRECGA